MPPLPAVPGTIKVTLLHNAPAGSPILTRFFIHYTGTAPTTAQLLTFLGSIRSAWTTNLAPLTPTAVSLIQTSGVDLSSSTGAVAADNVNVAGTRAGGTLAFGTAFQVQYLIARRYRGGKPKGFWPFGNAADLASGGIWSATLINAVATNILAFFNAIIAAGWTGAGTITQVNVSYFSGFSVITNPITHRARNVPTLRGTPTVDTVTGYVTETGVASQRRRNNQ